MKVVDIVFPLNSLCVLISFVAEKRVDFRQLLKDLAVTLRHALSCVKFQVVRNQRFMVV